MPPKSSAIKAETTPTEGTKTTAIYGLNRVTSHHRDPKCSQDVIGELTKDALTPVGGNTINLNPQGIAYLRQAHALVLTPAEIAALPAVLDKSRGGREEFGVCPSFTTSLVDATAQLGLFPMSLHFGQGMYLFSPKCHYERAYTLIYKRVGPPPSKKKGAAAAAAASSVINDDRADEKGGEEGPSPLSPTAASPSPSPSLSQIKCFDYAKLGISRKLLRKLEVRVHFVVRCGEQSMADLHQSLAMIRRQHSENWLCSSLRSCVQHMMMAPQSLPTLFYFLVVSEKRKEDASMGSRDEEKATKRSRAERAEGNGNEEKDQKNYKKGDEGKEREKEPILACDMGYIVGDIATAFTGAYEVDGTGSVTLAASAKLLELLGIPIWDLGMMMDYKKAVLGAVTKRRAQWLQTVKEHREAAEVAVGAVRSATGEDALSKVEWLTTQQQQQQVKQPSAQPKKANNTASSSAKAAEADLTNKNCKPTLLRDPRYQPLLHVLAKGVPADVFLAAASSKELIATILASNNDPTATTTPSSSSLPTTTATSSSSATEPFVPIVPTSSAAKGVEGDKSDNATADKEKSPLVSSENASKNKQKKAAKAAAAIAKKDAKKANGGVLPPRHEDKSVGRLGGDPTLAKAE